MTLTAELVSTGSELLSGRTVNRHAWALGAALGPLGIRLVRDTTVGDDLEAIMDAVNGAARRAPLVFISGGLGPTSDDITRDGLARLWGRSLAPDPGTLELLRERYARRGFVVSKESERQALVLEGAAVLPNPAGAAPGQRITLEHGKSAFVLPGPPREFRAILETHVVPWLREANAGTIVPRERIFLLAGYPESEAARYLETLGLAHGQGPVEVGYCAGPGQLEIRLTSSDEARLDELSTLLRAEFGTRLFAEERIPLEEAIMQFLGRRGMVAASAEIASLGSLAHRLSEADSSPGLYGGGLVVARNETLVRDLAISPEEIARHGSSSGPIAERMVEAIRLKYGADIGIAVSACRTENSAAAAPAHGRQEDNFVVVALDLLGACTSKEFNLLGTRDDVAEWSAQVALNYLWRKLQRCNSQ
jgi:nicotinamide-nucleotide amidase